MARRILLDSHVWVWMNGAVERLSAADRDLLTDPANELFLSAASAWELAIKVAACKLELPASPERYVPSQMLKNGVRPLPIHQGHALRAAALPLHHRDPFDRILIAQAKIEGLELMSSDSKLELYEVEILRAGV